MKTASPLALLVLSAAILLPGCGGSPPAKSADAPAPSSSELDASEPGEGRVASESAPVEKKEAFDSEAEEPAEEEAFAEEGEEADGLADLAASDEDEGPRNFIESLKTKRQMTRELKAQVGKLDGALNAAELSCDGAAPFRDAICAIAERLCDLDSSAKKESKQCSEAKKSCVDAKSRFKDKCG